jgi:hypothetical protein
MKDEFGVPPIGRIVSFLFVFSPTEDSDAHRDA